MAKGEDSPARRMAGLGLMLAAMAVLPLLDVVAKTLGQQGMPIVQVVWARMAVGACLIAPLALRAGGARAMWPQRMGVHSLRAAFLAGATFCFFLSLKTLPIADALAIFFVQPLVVTALSPLILNERVGRHRWAAVAVGFIGTLIIIRPGFQTIEAGMVLAFAAGTLLGIYMLLTRRIANRDPAAVTTFQTNLLGGLMISAALPLFWLWPTPQQWLLFVALGAIATLGHMLIVMAYDRAEASLLAPLGYTEMIGATAFGWLFFGDFPDGWTFVGVAILMGCAAYISARERKRMD